MPLCCIRFGWRTKPEVVRKLYPDIRRVFERVRILLRDQNGIATPCNPARWEDLKATGFETPAQLSKGRYPSLPFDQIATVVISSWLLRCGPYAPEIRPGWA